MAPLTACLANLHSVLPKPIHHSHSTCMMRKRSKSPNSKALTRKKPFLSDTIRWKRTCNARVVSLQVALQLDVARPDVVEVWLDDVDVAARSASTTSVHHPNDLGVAADESKVGPHAAAQTPAAVVR